MKEIERETVKERERVLSDTKQRHKMQKTMVIQGLKQERFLCLS